MTPPQSSEAPVAVARVAVAAPLDRTLSYRIPEELRPVLRIGHRVRVPLGRRTAVGYVFALAAEPAEGLKALVEILDPQPLFAACHATFYERAARYYAYPLGEAVRTALPAGLSGPGRRPAVLHDRHYRPGPAAGDPAGPLQRALLTFVRGAGGVSLAVLRARFPAPYAALQRLVEQGLLVVEEIERSRDPLAAEPVPPRAEVHLNADQESAVARLAAALAGGGFAPFLLFGVTGSGKTEVYLRAIAEVLKLGRQALVLVPEIGLTPQLVGRFRSWFQGLPVRLGLLHSGLNDGERYDAWRAAARGEVDVIIGVRSAVFAPLGRLGLIIVDEEHDASYKQGEGFRYHARDLALLRGQMEGATVILGSATPALTTWQRSCEGQLTCLELPARVAGRPLPAVEVVTPGDPAGEPLSLPLRAALAETLAAGDQALLLLNRRGYAPFLLCRECGATCRCPNCEITLTYSRVERAVRCHYCDYRETPPDVCPRCGGSRFVPEGAGTERLEEALRELFPEARIARMDRDTTSRKGAHGRLVSGMAAGAVDILIGTQMIAKGHDFGAVTLVGVLNADSALNLPDFRSAERVFALLSQAAGRAGRGDRPGRVLIQSFAPEHYALEFVARHDYRGFVDVELPQRRVLGYPPFGYLVNLVLSGNDREQVAAAADRLAAELARQAGEVEVLGPAPCLLQKLRGRSRMQILLKAGRRQPLRRLLDGSVATCRLPAGVGMTVDVDPLDMM
ncbi:MAG: primosomal protein N' [Deltaproteobacteria bacterium]|nr:MAG: primosomal protein N' [Deltaproteobacteria bacterium]